MKQVLFITAYLLLTSVFWGQQMGNNANYIEYKDSLNTYFTLSSEAYYSSSIFNNNFSNKLVYGGFISDEEKKDAPLNKRGLNHIGGEFNTSVSFSNSNDFLFSDFGYYVSLSYNYSLGAQITNDAYNLAFFGNKPFEGKEAQLAPSAFYLRDYNRFSFGLNKKNKLKVGLSLLSFNNNTGATIDKGLFFTDSNANSLSLNLEGSYYTVDTTKSVSFLSNNAIGIGLDFETTFTLKEHPNAQKIIVGIRNLGVLSQKNTYQIAVKNKYTFNGIELNNIGTLNTSGVITSSIIDSLKIEESIATKTSLLPFEIYFFQLPSYIKKIELIYGFRYKNESAFKAFIYAGGNVNITKKINFSSFVSHGGYANFQWGIGGQIKLQKMNFGVTSGNILGFFSKNTFGKSAGISLSYLL